MPEIHADTTSAGFVPLFGPDVGNRDRPDDSDPEGTSPLASAATYRALIEAMPHAGLVLGLDGAILYGNDQFAQLLGLPHRRLAGLTLDRWVMPDDQDAVDDLLARGRVAPAQGELRLARDDGIEVPTAVNAFPLQSRAARVIAAVVTDLTPQRCYEALRRAHQALNETNRRKDEALATLAHGLRHSLILLRNGLHLLQLAGPDIKAGAQARSVMARQLSALVRLLDQLHDVRGGGPTSGELRWEPLALSALVRHAIEDGRPMVEAAGHALIVSLPDDPLWVEGDGERLSHVIVTLLDNAARYTPRGGRVEVAAQRENGHAIVRVRDTGVGIPPEALPRVFDQFVQVQRPNGRSAAGLGIGLSVSRRLVELHGGSIEGRSDGPEQGSEFEVRLPLAQADHEAPEPSAPT